MKAAPPLADAKPVSAWRRGWHRLGHSLQLRMVLVFLLLAGGMSLVFILAAQRMLSLGWREAARPLVIDYVDRLAAEVAGPPGQAPNLERARAITQRLPVTIRIDGPVVRWASHPDQRSRPQALDERAGRDRAQLLQRSTADGHTIRFGIDEEVFAHHPGTMGLSLAALLLLTLLAWVAVRHLLLKPLQAIGQGARRFGRGDFSQAIRLRRPGRPDELGELAAALNTMGQDIQRMLDAKRALLLAISHELRSPITRARLHTELLPETAELQPQREALMRDLQEMSALITDLLESERLSGQHAVLHKAPTDLAALAHSVLQELNGQQSQAGGLHLVVPDHLPLLPLDPIRIRLLLRNLLDNACRHGGGASQAIDLRIDMDEAEVRITVRDHGPGVSDDQIGLLAQAFYRPDGARTRSAGGVGLGLYLCRLVAEAHGGQLRIQNARPGLQVTASLPIRPIPLVPLVPPRPPGPPKAGAGDGNRTHV